MSNDLHETPEFHLKELAAWVESLVAALAEVGVGGPQLREILSQKVQIRCVDCGAVASGEEASEAVAFAEGTPSPPPPTGEGDTPRRRLAHHQCLRPECASRYYRWAFSPVESLSWKTVLERAEQLRAARRTLAKGEHEIQAEERRIQRRQSILGILLIVTGLASLWAVRRWWQTGVFPGRRKARTYQVDPRSLPSAADDR